MIRPELTESEWGEQYTRLCAFARKLLSKLGCFSTSGRNVFLAGKEPHDYAMQAIEMHLRHPEKYDPNSGRSLDNYLKLHLVRSVVWKDTKSAENRTTQHLPVKQEEDGDGELIEALLPWVEENLDQNLDYENFSSFIEERLIGDSDAEIVYLGLYHFGQKRKDIIKENSMTESTYNNAVRRLDTIISTTVTVFNLKTTAK